LDNHFVVRLADLRCGNVGETELAAGSAWSLSDDAPAGCDEVDILNRARDDVLRTRWIMSSMTDAQYAIRASDWKGGARCEPLVSSDVAIGDFSGIGENLGT
jgi:hypothetical protein